MRSRSHILDLQKSEKLNIMGLMSGTSADGLDWCCSEFTGTGIYPEFSILESGTIPYPEEMMRMFKDPLLMTVSGAADLHYRYGRWLTEVLADRIKGVDLIASHGQTLVHQPPAFSLQVGEPGELIQAFDIPVVYDFRTADVLAGGQGAPLIPIVDDLLFRPRSHWTLALNIGGIANLTALPPSGSNHLITAWDSGPGNTLIDRAVRAFTQDSQSYDDGGKLAVSGQLNRSWLQTMLQHDFLGQAPPRSAGQEDFGSEYYEELLRICQPGTEQSWLDLICTLTHYTAECIVHSWNSFGPAELPEQVMVSGGGAHNDYLVEQLALRFPDVELRKLDQDGLGVDNKEAFGFAYLGYLNLRRFPGNLPSVTGANGPRILGKLIW